MPDVKTAVEKAVKQVRALRNLEDETGSRFTHSINDILRALTGDVLVEVALVLDQDNYTHARDTGGQRSSSVGF